MLSEGAIRRINRSDCPMAKKDKESSQEDALNNESYRITLLETQENERQLSQENFMIIQFRISQVLCIKQRVVS